LNIYLNNGYTESELDSISYYKFVDIIQFKNYLLNGTNFIKTYIRFALRLSSGNINGINYNNNGKVIRPCSTENIVFSTSLNNFLSNFSNVALLDSFSGTLVNSSAVADTGTFDGTFKGTQSTSGILTEYKFNLNNPLVGRALLFRWIFDKRDNAYINYEINTNNEKKRSLLNILAWPIANSTNSIYTIDQNSGFRFIQTNYQIKYANKTNLSLNRTDTSNTIPDLSLSLQKFGDSYYFVNNSYIYLKINFNVNSKNDNVLINAISQNNLQYDQNYIDETSFIVPIGGDYMCIENYKDLTVYTKDQSYIFAKLILSNNPGNTDTTLSNIINNNSFSINYNDVLDNISSISVSVYDSNLKLLLIKNDFSFTLNVHEIKDVLKETLINSKTNNVTSTGNFI